MAGNNSTGVQQRAVCCIDEEATVGFRWVAQLLEFHELAETVVNNGTLAFIVQSHADLL